MSVAQAQRCKAYQRYFWSEYYQEFPYFSEQTVRPGCHPCRLLHENQPGKAIVLVHGLTDSPFYMLAIAEYFHEILGYDVYLPLLQCHGLQHPAGMEGVSLAEWKKNVHYAVRCAAEKDGRVSIGGLSTGGALSLYFGCTEPQVTGDVYLFSAALGLYFGWILEFLLRRSFFMLLDNGKTLDGNNPFRYGRVPLNSARELTWLMREIDMLRYAETDESQKKRIFAAWSEYDRVINVHKLESLRNCNDENHFVPFVIPAAARVDHACVVLQEPLYAIDSRPGDPPLEVANPYFSQMMAAMSRFESAG